MEEKVQAIGMTMAHAAENLLHEQDGVKCFAVMSASIYTVHFKPLEDALAKAEADKAVLVEALEECVDVMETTDDANMQKAIIGALKQAHAALARVKGGSMSDGNSYPWADKSYCPGLGCWEDCYQTSECAHQKDCAESDKDTRRNYCPACGKLNEECVCKESPCPKN